MLERDAIRELCDYTDFTWAVYERALGSLPPGMLTTAVPGSGWPALIDAFRHFCDAYETWLHERLGARAVIVADPASVVDWPGIAEWRRQTRASLPASWRTRPTTGSTSPTSPFRTASP
jgi:hypothetical protein